MKIIVAEDNKRENREICNIIEESGLPVQICETFSNGLAAFEYLKNNDTDILISDIQMPKLNGINLIKEINKNGLLTKVIFVSCYDTPSYLIDAINNKAAYYILKPIDKNKLIDCLKILIDDLNEQKKLKDEARQSQNLKKLAIEQALNNMIFNKKDPLAKKLLDKYIKNEYKTVIIIEIEDNDRFSSLMQNDSYETSALKCFINELNTDDIKFYPVSVDTTSLAIIMTSKNEKENISDILESFQRDTVATLGMNVKFGISGSTTDFSDLSLLYKEASEALAYISASDENKIINYKDIEKIKKNRTDPTKIAKKLSEALDNGDKKNIEAIIDSYINETSNNSEYAKKIAYILVNTAEIYLNKNNRSIEELTGKSIWDKISKTNTIPDLKQYLLNLFSMATDMPNSTSIENDNSITEKIKEIIEEDFKNKITAEYISKKLNYSPQYLNVVFKKNTGKTIFEYLTEFRIEKAKAFLKEPNSKIYLISQKIGYSKISHFRTIFKKHTGISPQEYRHSIAKHNMP